MLYRASQKDVPDFNNLLLEFNITQVNRIIIDGKENSPNFFGAIQIFNMCSTRNTTHIKPVMKFVPNSS
jgi:hypothetical protein